MTLNKKVLLPLVFPLAAVVAFLLLRMTRAEPPPAEIKERVWRVEVLRVQPESLAPTLTLYGKVETPNVLKAAAPAEAVVEKVLVKEGEPVVRGHLLLQLDERDFLPRLGQVRAEVEQLQAEISSEQKRHASDLEALQQEQEILRLARAAVSRAQRLQKKNLGSDSALDDARQNGARQALVVISRRYRVNDHDARLRKLHAQLAQARARLQETELEFERSRLTAPFAGVVARVRVAPGDRVRKADVMLEMYDPRSLEVRARVPAPYREELQQSLRAGVIVQGRTRLDGTEVVLRLARLSGEADPSGIDGLFEIEQGLGWLRLGEMIEFRLRRPARANTFAIPYQALHGGNRIYTLREGRMQGVVVEPLGNLLDEKGGERLVVASREVRAGDPIVITHLPNAMTGLRAEAVP